MPKIYKTVAALLLLLPLKLSAQQDSVVQLYCNPSLYEATDHSSVQNRYRHGKKASLNLPFFEDFSSGGKLPNDLLWEDIYVFVNRTMAVNPPSVGVATFDGINQYGRAYNPGDESDNARPADTLTSKPIDLSLYTEADSIYLSFFWQPQGYGERPESIDSLILQFRAKNNPNPNKWKRVWSTRGRGLTSFNQAMIKLRLDTNFNFFTDSFQFRFINYGNHSGNYDHWHVDFIYMDRNRSLNDTTYEDVAIYYPAASLSKYYYTMPWKHFIYNLNSQLSSEVGIYATNNSDKIKNVTYGYSITDISNGNEISNTFNQQSDNLDPNVHTRFPLQTQFNNNLPPSNSDKVILLVKTAVKNIPDDFPQNDTAFNYQIFDNYLAHDDGTAEYGYGLRGQFSSGKVAIPFSISQPDTLYGVLIYFNQLDADVSNYQFTLAAWNKKEDDPIAALDFVRPRYDAGVGEFTYLEFENPVKVESQFHIGWIQPAFFINIGLDSSYGQIYNSSVDTRKFSSFGQEWTESTYGGAVMIRPVLGKRYVGIHKVLNPVKEFDVVIYPNPASSELTIKLPDYGNFNAKIMDMTGKEVEYIQHFNSTISLDCSNYPQGIYLIQVVNNATGRAISKKLIVH